MGILVQKSGHIGAKIGGYIGARPNVIRVGILVPDSLGKDGAHPGSAELVYALLLASADAVFSALKFPLQFVVQCNLHQA